MADSNPPKTVKLAASVLETVTNLEKYLEQNGHPSCSFEPGAPLHLPLETNPSIEKALSDLQELTSLLLGPMGWMVYTLGQVYDMVSMQAMYRYKIPLRFPVGETIAIVELARRCEVDEDMFTRIVQHAVTKRYLAQPVPGNIAHTAFSAMLANSPPLVEWVGHVSEDLWPAATRILEATIKWPGPPWLPTQTGHNLAEGTFVSYFETLKSDPVRAERFDTAMSIMQSMPGWQPAAALEVYDWGALGPDAVVVDVGGGDGTFAKALAQRHPKLKRIIVQDVATVVEKATNSFPGDMRDVISFQTHDFFQPQPVKHADVYFIRRILHDWPHEFAVKILQQLAQAMKPGARLLINEHCMSPLDSMSMYGEWMTRSQDLAMMAVLNSKERTKAEWGDLVAAADPRFVLKSMIPMPPGPLALMEVVRE